MRPFAACILVLACLLLPAVADAYQLLLLISSRDKGYQVAVSGLQQGKRLSQRVIYLSDYAEADVARIIREDRPEVVVAVGDRALAAAANSRLRPVVSLMSLTMHRVAASSPNVTGVELLVRPERYVSLFNAMNLKRVAFLYDPDRSGYYVKAAEHAAARYGITLLPGVVRSPKEVVTQLTQFAGEADAVWLIPDASAINQQSAEAYFLYSMTEHVPVISFNSHHLQLGGSVVIEADREEMGRQAGELVAAILGGAQVHELPPVAPRKTVQRLNAGVLKRLGIAPEAIARLQKGRE